VGFETTIPAGEQAQTYALDRAATGIGKGQSFVLDLFYFVSFFYCHPLSATSKGGLFQMTLTKQNITRNFTLHHT